MLIAVAVASLRADAMADVLLMPSIGVEKKLRSPLDTPPVRGKPSKILPNRSRRRRKS